MCQKVERAFGFFTCQDKIYVQTHTHTYKYVQHIYKEIDRPQGLLGG